METFILSSGDYLLGMSLKEPDESDEDFERRVLRVIEDERELFDALDE